MRLLAATLVMLAGTASAADHQHTVGQNETLESLARQYYGSSWKWVYIAARNTGLEEGKPLPAGKRLYVPSCSLYKVKKGDSVAGIAKRYMGESERYKLLMQENGLKDASDLQVGQELLMPFVLKHIVQTGEGLSQVSRHYYRTTKRAGLLKEYNKTDQFNPGDKLFVPVFDRAALDVRLREKSVEPAAPKEVAAEPLAVPTAAAAADEEAEEVSDQKPLSERKADIRRAIDGYRAGEFETACKSLEELLSVRGFSESERSQVVSHLGFCAVAAGERQAAADYFTKWIELDGRAQLDPISTSPKILEVFYEAREKRAAQ